jgi:hypothetical protein
MRFVSDGGSANARVEMFELFSYFSTSDLILGPDINYLESLRRINGLEWGIENPVIRMTLYQGAFVAFVVLGSFCLFLRELARNREAGVGWPLVAALILLNTSESVATKTTIAAKFVVIIVCMFRKETAGVIPVQPPDFSPSASRIAGSKARVRSSMRPMPSNRFQNAQGKP